MTEATNDHFVRDFPAGKIQHLDAVDSGAVNAVYRINAVPSLGAFGQSGLAAAKSPNDINVLAASAKVQSPATVIQLSNSLSQQQLADTYALPLSNQPQLQQHFLQQQQSPYAVYNPTYLVTQSNQLLNQHKQQLFKPAATFTGSFNVATDLDTPDVQALYQGQPVASPGQIYSAHQDHINEYSLASLQGASSTANSPTFERLVSADSPKSNTISESVQQQPILSEQEVANLLNFGTLNGHSNPAYLSVNYFQAPSSDSPLRSGIEYDQPTKQQLLNENTIRQAQEEIKLQKGQATTTTPASTSYQFVSTGPTQTPASSADGSALDQHQKRLADHFNDQNPLRIYVPDDDFSSNVNIINLLSMNLHPLPNNSFHFHFNSTDGSNKTRIS